MLGRVLLLHSGRVAYFGTPQAVAAHFSAVGRPLAPVPCNPADAMLDAVTQVLQ
jgi:hypothetical protein